LADRLLIIGQGGHARVVSDAATSMGLIPQLATASTADEIEQIARSAKLERCIVAVGFNPQRVLHIAAVLSIGLTLTSVIHSTAFVSPSAVISGGVAILPGAIVNANAELDEGVIVNTRGSVDHDAALASCSSVGPSAALGGNVRIGICAFIGIGASVVHGRTVGDHAVIGAGAVVTRDIPALTVAYGIPARVVRPRERTTPYLS
jgi:sugar O-acyltransferase (sialic acid O-acetyltransferase NeuD family)